MSQKALHRTITTAFFVATLALTGTSEAGGLFSTIPASETKIEQSLWAQTWDWMASAFEDLVGISSEKTGGGATATPATTTTIPSTTTSCTNPAGCEAGWGIDPNG